VKKFWIIVKDNLINSIRSKKAIIFLALYFIIFWLIMYVFIEIQEYFDAFTKHGVNNPEIKRNIKWFVRLMLNSTNNELINHLMSVPFFNIGLFILTLSGTPLLILIAKYDVLNQEIYDGTIRFFLFRVSRMKIYFAKYLSSMLEFAILTFFALIVSVIWAVIALPRLNFLHSFYAGIKFWLVSQLFLSVFVSLTLMISVLIRKPFISLLLSFLGLLIFILLTIWFNYISPLNSLYLKGLFYGVSLELLISAIGYITFSAIFLSIGAFVFQRKNL